MVHVESKGMMKLRLGYQQHACGNEKFVCRRGAKDWETKLMARMNTRICLEELSKRKGKCELILKECDSNLVCFYYIPELVRFRFHGSFGGRERIARIIRNNKVD